MNGERLDADKILSAFVEFMSEEPDNATRPEELPGYVTGYIGTQMRFDELRTRLLNLHGLNFVDLEDLRQFGILKIHESKKYGYGDVCVLIKFIYLICMIYFDKKPIVSLVISEDELCSGYMRNQFETSESGHMVCGLCSGQHIHCEKHGEWRCRKFDNGICFNSAARCHLYHVLASSDVMYRVTERMTECSNHTHFFQGNICVAMYPPNEVLLK